LPKFNATTKPNHAASGFPTTCETCHTPTAWTPATFDHGTTRFPLVGAHRTVTCVGCHSDGVYRGKTMVCSGCHLPKFNATTKPNHVTSGFPNTCETCHTATAWTPATFNHATTRFPLTGLHAAVTCTGCHGDGVFKGKTMVCSGCHQAKFAATTKPNHTTVAFATTCETCHTTAGWVPSTWSHSTTKFPLAGGHLAVTCAGCHGDGVFRGKPMTCVSCHQAKFNATTKPSHTASGFPTTCETCHSVNAWTPASFNHATTRFPLTGLHASVSCTGCHGDGVFKGKTMLCSGCHQAKYAATTKPKHTTVAFATTCESCHTTAGWVPSSWSHSVTRFPLTGAHVSQTCLACHGDLVYRGKSMVCSSCHLTDYNTTTNPNHKTAAFPTTCESCHTTTQWKGATFNHDGWFPIYSGKHKAKWTTCTQCHTNSANYKDFTCLTCHEHAQTTMDAKHKGRNGYAYQSPLCYSCHPRGTAG
jgi:nitrate/TMAO reductase-like tetraheme cytochrome c subunit